MEITAGAMEKISAAARDAAVLRQREERNRVKLTEARTESSPAAAKSTCSCPTSISASVTMEYTICMEVSAHSQPNRLLEARMYTAAQIAKAAPLTSRAAAAFAAPRRALPCLVQRRMLSAPD
jgi:hypothetical protein